MFIVIDGIDGSGKGTQTTELEKYFISLGKKVLILDFPRYSEESSFFVKEYLNQKYGDFVEPKTASTFYALDRYDAFQKNKNIWSDFDIIISNRYTSASMIHQGGKINNNEEKQEFFSWLLDFEYNILGIPKPDKVIILDVEPEIAQKYIEKKLKREYIKGEENKDIHEKDLNHLQNAYNTIQVLVQNFSDFESIKCTKGDEMLEKEEITKKIIENISLKN